MTKTTRLKLAVAALALLCGHANAQELKLNVSGTSKAWDNRVNPDYPIGIDEGSSPAVARGLSLRAGEKIRITATGGTQTFPNGTRIGPEGQQDYAADDYPGGSGRFFPSKYVDPSDFPAFLNELIGVFVDARGRIVGKPFPVGKDWKGLVPKGAVTLQFGINDDVLNDNSGEISVVVELKADFPDGDLAKVAPAAPPPPVILEPYPEHPPAPVTVRPEYNTLIADGSRYSADPAPIVPIPTMPRTHSEMMARSHSDIMAPTLGVPLTIDWLSDCCVQVKGEFGFRRRMDSPFNWMRWALWTSLSRMASA